MTYRWRLILSFVLAPLLFWIGLKFMPEFKGDLRVLILYVLPLFLGAWTPWFGWSESPYNMRIKRLIPLILKGEKDKIQLQIDRGADLNCREVVSLHDDGGQGGKDKTYPLLIAAKEGDKDIVELLLNGGAEINIKGLFEETALHLSARNGHKDVVKLLITKGAEMNLKDSYTFTALDYAENILRHQKLKISSELKENKLETAKILRENKAKLSKELFTLSKLVKSGSINEVIDFLHDELNKDEVNEVNDVGSTPSHFAAQRGEEKILELLFKNGANLNVRNKYSHTPLDMSFNQASANLIRKHGGKTGEELKAEGK